MDKRAQCLDRPLSTAETRIGLVLDGKVMVLIVLASATFLMPWIHQVSKHLSILGEGREVGLQAALLFHTELKSLMTHC